MTATSCPLCRTAFPTGSAETMASGANVVCSRCDVRWDAARLETVAAYARYVADRAALDGPAGPATSRWR